MNPFKVTADVSVDPQDTDGSTLKIDIRVKMPEDENGNAGPSIASVEHQFDSLVSKSFLKTLSRLQIDELLGAVLEELRGRDLDHLKQDVLTRSQALRLGKNSDD